MEHFTELAKNKTSEDLLTMVYQWDQWSPELLHAVEIELTTRNQLPPDIAELKEQHIQSEAISLGKGKEAGITGLVIGWLLCFGLIGVGIGYHYTFSKTVSKYNGKVYYTYDEKSRNNGRILFYASLAISLSFILVKFIPDYSF